MRILYLGLLAAIFAPLSAQQFVVQSAAEFTAAGDFDGDGLQDIVIIDRQSGAYRIAYDDGAGGYEWSDPRASGAEDLTGVSVGRLLDLGRDAIALTAPALNKVVIVDAQSRTQTTTPQSVYLDGVGPNMTLAIDVGGGGNTAHDDLIIGSLWNDLPNAHQFHTKRATAFSDLSAANGAQAERGNPVVLTGGGPILAAYMLRSGSGDTFEVFDTSAGFNPGSPLISQGGLPSGSDYAVGNFDGSGDAHVVFFTPGSTDVSIRPVNPGPTLGAAANYTLTQPIDHISVLPNPGLADRLVIIFDGGTAASVYDFDGVSSPTVFQNLTAPSGSVFTGAPALADGTFLMLTTNSGGIQTSTADHHHFSGGSYISTGASTSFMPLASGSAAPTVLTFDAEPFITDNARLVRALQAGQWSTDINLGANIDVTTETWQNTTDGLGAPATVNLGAKLVDETYALRSQVRDDMSVHAFTTADGAKLDDYKIVPPGGNFDQLVTVTFTPAPPVGPPVLFYRLTGQTSWTPYTAPFTIMADTVVDYYADAGSGNTPIQSALFTFGADPGSLDSDGDGVPDLVELQQGLDPMGGNDSDGDGFSDLEELIMGSDPLDGGSTPNGWTPGNGPRPSLEQNAAYDLLVTPAMYDGFVPASADADAGAEITAYDLFGQPIGSGYIGGNPDDLSDLALWLRADTLSLSDNDPVLDWNDTRAGGAHLTQSDAAKRPVFKRAGLAGRQSVRFDGGDVLVSDLKWAFDDFTVILVYADTGATSALEYLVDHDASTGFRVGRQNNTSSNWGGGILEGTGGGYSSFGSGAQILAFQREGTTNTIRKSGVVVNTRSVSGTTTAEKEIAAGGRIDGASASQWLSGDIAEILVYSRALTNDEHDAVQAYLDVKYATGTHEARIAGVGVDTTRPLVAVATEAHLNIDTSNADPRIGREVAALIEPPVVAPVEILYTYGSGSQATEAANWLSAAQTAYNGASAQTLAVTADHHDTLATMLTERKIAAIMANRLIDIGSGDLSLLSFRSGDNGRFVPSSEQLTAIQAPHDADDGYRLADMVATIKDEILNNTDAGVVQLKTMNEKVWEISSRLHSTNAYRMPIDVMRDFLTLGTLDANYLTESGYSAAQLASALAGAQTVLGAVTERPLETHFLTITSTTFSGACVTLETQTGDPKSLFDAQGQPFQLNQSGTINLTPGVILRVIAYADSNASACASEDVLEVVDAAIVDVPTPPTSNKTKKPQGEPEPEADEEGPYFVRNYAPGELQEEVERNYYRRVQTTKPNIPEEIRYVTRIEIPGEKATELIGNWWFEYNAALSEAGRGLASFDLNIPRADLYRLEIQAGGDVEGESTRHLRLWIDDLYLGRHAFVSTNARGKFHLQLPWLNDGDHQLRVLWDDVNTTGEFRLDFIRLQERIGPDSDRDGVKNWAADHLYQNNRADVVPARSAVSPAVVEGYGEFHPLITVNGQTAASLAQGRWYARVPLNPEHAADIEVAYQHGILRENHAITWEPTNLFAGENLHIRVGDSLLLTAAPLDLRGATGKARVTINNETLVLDSGQHLPHRFDQPGTYNLGAQWTSSKGLKRQGQITVTVHADPFTEQPALWVGNSRDLDLRGVTEETYISLDEGLTITPKSLLRAKRASGRAGGGTSAIPGGIRYQLSIDTPETRHLEARLTEGGLLLGATPVHGFSVHTANETFVTVEEEYEDGTQLIAIGLIASGMPPDASLKLTVIVGGVTFRDGTINQTFKADDFDRLGRATAYFLRGPKAKTSVCHITEAYQNYRFIGTVAQLRDEEEQR